MRGLRQKFSMEFDRKLGILVTLPIFFPSSQIYFDSQTINLTFNSKAAKRFSSPEPRAPGELIG